MVLSDIVFNLNAVYFCWDKQTSPTPEEMGRCDSVYLSEVGDTQVVVFKHGKENSMLYPVFTNYTCTRCVDWCVLTFH